MSRSYKKTPIVKDGHSGRFGKTFANRKVRRCKEPIANGKAYRKVFNPWDIHDYVDYCSYGDFKKRQESVFKNKAQGLDRYSSWYEDDQNWFNAFKRK